MFLFFPRLSLTGEFDSHCLHEKHILTSSKYVTISFTLVPTSASTKERIVLFDLHMLTFVTVKAAWRTRSSLLQPPL